MKFPIASTKELLKVNAALAKAVFEMGKSIPRHTTSCLGHSPLYDCDQCTLQRTCQRLKERV
jgi:uncharacterized protein (UPF0179 family)